MKTYPFISLALLFSLNGFADISQAPPRFQYGDSQAVFVDFLSADYTITYDRAAKNAVVHSRIELQQPAEGHVLFDLVPDVASAKLDGMSVDVKEISLPGNASKMRILSTQSRAGKHILEVVSPHTELVVYYSNGVRSSFWASDLQDRNYLEKYVPANLEYDQVPMKFTVRFENNTVDQEIFTNGSVRRISGTHYEITYPDYFNAASLYFHTAPVGTFAVEEATYVSIDGRELPITSYSGQKHTSLQGVASAKLLLQELEADYGPWPHPSLIVYAAGFGGMEYAGATMTELQYLGHEMFHSYHARGLMPANGDSGWMDEAIAKWRDNGYRLRPQAGSSSTKLSGRSPYLRWTPTNAYTQGELFMGFLASKTGTDASAFKGFLRDYFQKYKYTTVTTELFRKELETHTGLDLTADFAHHVYGENRAANVPSLLRVNEENPVHRKMTKEQLRSLL